MNTTARAGILVLILLAIIGGIFAFRHGTDSGPGDNNEDPGTVSGTVVGMALSARTITVRTEGQNQIILALVDDTRLSDSDGNAIGLPDITQGSVIEAKGRRTGIDTIIPDSVRLVMSANGEGGEADLCPQSAGEDDSSGTCRMQAASRIRISLPSGEFDMQRLVVDPARKMGETFGADAPAGESSITLEAVEAGQAIVTVPRIAGDGGDFRLTVRIFDPDTVLNQGTI